MTPELQTRLYQDFPELFRQADLPMTQTCMCWGICMGDGWEPIVRNLCGCLQSARRSISRGVKGTDPKNIHWARFPQIEFAQVKEKFASGRFYIDIVPEECPEGVDPGNWKTVRSDFMREVDGMISFAEHMTKNTCEKCGKAGFMHSRFGWYKTLCPDCAVANEYKQIPPAKGEN